MLPSPTVSGLGELMLAYASQNMVYDLLLQESKKAGGLEPVTAREDTYQNFCSTICLPKHLHKAAVPSETLENMICRPQARENACSLREPGHSEIRR
jgi:hypothetical protein